jgi:hypothetical protein
MMKKRYWAIAILAFMVWLDWYIRAPDARSRELTTAIAAQASPALQAYPYHFRVLKVVGTTAYLSTPRNVEVPAFKALAALFPEIDTRNPEDPAFVAAQQRLGAIQSEARLLLLAQPGIKEVQWELDREWLAEHAIEPPPR